MKLAIFAVGFLTYLAFSSPPAHAQATRVFVAAQGSDTNQCSFAAPCRTFQHAHDIVASDGEIDVLDPAGYGSLTITKSISIQGHGFSGVSAPSGNAITINSGPADKINLQGLLIDGVGSGSNGVQFNSGKSLVIQNLFIRNFSGSGVSFMPGAIGNLVASHTIVSDNGVNGILVQPTGHFRYEVVLKHVEAYNNVSSGITISGTSMSGGEIRGYAGDCIASDTGRLLSASTGFLATSSTGQGAVTFRVTRSTATGNTNGMIANGALAAMVVSQSDLDQNLTNWGATNGGFLASFGDNETAPSISAPNVFTKN
jgi:hypothetical protein